MDYLIIFTNMTEHKKREGFKGQHSIVLPITTINKFNNSQITKNLFITDIGYYPEAFLHYRKRMKGSKQNILIYCSSGEGWIILNNQKYLINENEYFILPSGTPHIYGSNTTNPWTIYWLHFNGEQSDNFVPLPDELIVKLIENNIWKNNRIKLFNEIYDTLEKGSSIDDIEYSSICLMHFLASFKYHTQYSQTQILQSPDTISRSIQFMKSHLSDKIQLIDIANFVKLSPSHFSMLFKKKTTHSPMDYLIELRIEKAREYLDNSMLKINEIARITGFDDPYYFSRIFKKTMGLSPYNYKKMQQE